MPPTVGPGIANRLVRLQNGVEMPRIGLGTFRVRGNDVEIAVSAALDAGLRCVDTASIYKNEFEIAAALRASSVPREDVFLTSKISPYEQGTEKAQRACEEILERLGTDYIDCLLVHWPGVAKTPLSSPDNKQKRMETWRVLESMYIQGRCKSIGVSNYEIRHLEELCGIAEVLPMVNQVECHPAYPQAALRQRCDELGVAVVAYASMAQGKLLTHPVVEEIAKKYGKTPAQVLVRWGIQAGCCVIPKSVQPDRIQQYAEGELLAWHLAEDSLRQLDALGTKPQKYCWDSADVA